MGPEFYLAFQAATAAVAGIRACCEALSEGKAEIIRIKKGVEDAKAIVNEAKSVWSLIGSFFKKPEPTASVGDKPAEKASKPKDEYIEHEQTREEIEDKFFDNMIKFMEAQTIILDALEEERERLLNTFNPKQNNRKAAAELMRNERKIHLLMVEFNNLTAGAPRVLGAVREQFTEKYAVVVEAQARAKERERIRKQRESWQRDSDRSDRIDLLVALFVTLILVVELWAIWIKVFIV